MSEGSPAGGGPLGTTSIASAFDRGTVVVRPGGDVVARSPGVLLVTRVADNEEGDRALGAVLALIDAHTNRGTAPSTTLLQGLLTLIEDGTAPTDLVMVAATDTHVTVVLAGAGTVSAAGKELRLAARDVPVLTHELDWSSSPYLLELTPDHGPPSDRAPARATRTRFDLRAGVVPGSAAILTPPPTDAVPGRSVAPGSAGGVLKPATKIQKAMGPAPPRRHDRILGVIQVGAPRAPLPLPMVGPRPGAGSDEGEAAVATVRGYLCRDSHLNDPRALFCAICGIRMAESTSILVEGPRPPLGLLVFDNGASFSLDDSYVLGREPEVDERVRAGQLRPLVLFDTTGAISRRHAEIRLDDWDALLIDCGSANGTLVAERDAVVWSSLMPGQPIRMQASMQVRIGDRTFVFESLHGAP